MAVESGYATVVRAIADQLKAFTGLEGVRVLVEQDPTFGLPDDGGRAIVVEALRRRPSPGQSMAAGRRLRSRFSVVLSVAGFDMESYDAAAAKRDGVIEQAELAIMEDRTIGGRVANLEIMGGDLYRASAPGNSAPFVAAAETHLEMDISAIYS